MIAARLAVRVLDSLITSQQSVLLGKSLLEDQLLRGPAPSLPCSWTRKETPADEDRPSAGRLSHGSPADKSSLVAPRRMAHGVGVEIGRASCRERVWRAGVVGWVA